MNYYAIVLSLPTLRSPTAGGRGTVSVSAIPVIVQGVCHQAQPCGKAQEWPNRPRDVDWRFRESLRPQSFGCLVACNSVLESNPGSSLSVPRATSAGQILSLVLNKQKQRGGRDATPPPRFGGWAWD
jgi:hypothetical protein